MPNQPDPNNQHLTISAVPRTLVVAAKAKAAERGESISAAVRRFLEEYVK